MSNIRNILTQPESGWVRYDCTSSNNQFFDKQNGPWTFSAGDSAPYYYYGYTEGSMFSFKFYGSKFRILAQISKQVSRLAVRVNGGTRNFITLNPNSGESDSQHYTLVYEQDFDIFQIHEVLIEVIDKPKYSGNYYRINAIDIDSPGYAVLSSTPIGPKYKVGDVLKEPEPGWNRIDDTNPDITYIGEHWRSRSAKYYYNETFTTRYGVADNQPGTVRFLFKGTGIRIIAPMYESGRKDVKVEIDGLFRGTYKGSDQRVNGAKYQLLAHEILGLEDKIHEIKLTVTGGDLAVDAFDILGGTIIHEVKVGDILLQPEPGWQRFDDSDPLISYAGPWSVSTNTPLDNYNKTLHVKSYRNSTAAEFKFTFKGTGIRLIATLSDVPDFNVESTITIDGASETFKGYHIPYIIQGLAFQKLNLQDGVHTVKVSTPVFLFDAVDIQNGELISQDVIKKPKVSLYEKESGKIFVDDFDSVNPKWLMSPSNAFNSAIKKGFLRMNPSADKDVMLLIDKPQSNFAIQVIADYTPTKEGDKGGLLIYKNESNNIEFLESMKVSDSPDPKEWMAVCKENQWDFYNKTDVTFDYVSSEQLEAYKIGVVLKKGNAEGFTPLDINKIIITTSNLLRLRQLYEKYKVVLKDAAETVISTSFVEAANTGIDIPLPSLEFEGIVEIYDEDGTLVAKRQTTFFGGDMYCMGSSLHISMDTKELDETDPTNLGYMTETERLVKMTLTNDNIGSVSNVKVAIQQYMEKFGYTWAHLSLDGSHYTDELAIETLDSGSSKDFWVKIIKDVNYMAFEPIYFNIHLSHE